MAVYSWIYANARKKGDEGDYLIRRCDPGLGAHRDTMKTISRRMLSTAKRYGAAQRQRCWFSGFLDGTVYVTAVAGEQEDLLDTVFTGGAFRRQYCVLAFGFTGKDIRLYRRGDALFEPLKRELCEIQGVECGVKLRDAAAEAAFSGTEALPAAGRGTLADAGRGREKFNIIKSSEAADERLWEESFQRPAATGLLCVEDAKKVLDLFPDGMTTVTEDVAISYRTGQAGADGLKAQLEREAADEEMRKKEQAALRRQTEEMRAEVKNRQEEAASSHRRWSLPVWLLAGAAAGLMLLLSLLL